MSRSGSYKKNKIQMDFLASDDEESGLIHESENILCAEMHSKILTNILALFYLFFVSQFLRSRKV